jgi:hypothetical protein
MSLDPPVAPTRPPSRVMSLDPPVAPTRPPSRVMSLDPPVAPASLSAGSSSTGPASPDAPSPLPAFVARWRTGLAVGAAAIVAVVLLAGRDPPGAAKKTSTASSSSPTASTSTASSTPTRAAELARLGAIIRGRPGDVAARDALLARARLQADAGEWARARDDLLRLLRRSDVDPVRAEATALLQRVEDGRRQGRGVTR